MPKDNFATLDKDIQSHIERLKKHPPKTIEALANELSGTSLDFSRDILGLLIELRGWSYQQMNALGGALEEANARIAELEAPQDSVIIPEDAEMLMSLIEATKALVLRNLEMSPPDEIRSGLVAIQELADKCAELIADSVLREEEDDDPGGEDEEEEPDDGEEEDPAQLTTGTGT
jgi:hypothetical protein